MCYQYASEVFGKNASYLKIGFSYPLPDEKIREFSSQVDRIYVIEENDPIIEERVKMLGFECHGDTFLHTASSHQMLSEGPCTERPIQTLNMIEHGRS